MHPFLTVGGSGSVRGIGLGRAVNSSRILVNPSGFAVRFATMMHSMNPDTILFAPKDYPKATCLKSVANRFATSHALNISAPILGKTPNGSLDAIKVPLC